MIGIFVMAWIVLACITCPMIGSWISQKWCSHENNAPMTGAKRLRLSEKYSGNVVSTHENDSYFENFLRWLESLLVLTDDNYEKDLENCLRLQDSLKQHSDFGLGILQTKTNDKGQIERVYEYPEKTVIHVYDSDHTPINEQYIYKTGIKVEKQYNELGWFSTTKFPSGSFIEEELDYSAGLRKKVEYLNNGVKIETVNNLIESWTKKFTYDHDGMLSTGCFVEVEEGVVQDQSLV